MAGTLKDITENYEKLHRLEMIKAILDEMHSFVYDIVSRLDEDFDDCVDFEDYITDAVIKNTKEGISTLQRYLDKTSLLLEKKGDNNG